MGVAKSSRSGHAYIHTACTADFLCRACQRKRDVRNSLHYQCASDAYAYEEPSNTYLENHNGAPLEKAATVDPKLLSRLPASDTDLVIRTLLFHNGLG